MQIISTTVMYKRISKEALKNAYKKVNNIVEDKDGKYWTKLRVGNGWLLNEINKNKYQ